MGLWKGTCRSFLWRDAYKDSVFPVQIWGGFLQQSLTYNRKQLNIEVGARRNYWCRKLIFVMKCNWNKSLWRMSPAIITNKLTSLRALVCTSVWLDVCVCVCVTRLFTVITLMFENVFICSCYMHLWICVWVRVVMQLSGLDWAGLTAYQITAQIHAPTSAHTHYRIC